MTRIEWINEILLPWKPGDIVQFMPEHVGKWGDCNAPGADFDPMSGFTPDLAHGKFRIKPKLVKFVVVFNEDTDFPFISAALATSGILDSRPDIAKGLRHAVRLDNGN